MAKVLQANVNRSRTAQDLLGQLYLDKSVDVVIINEQYQDRAESGWYRDDLGTAAIWVFDPRRFRVERHGSGCDHVWVRGSGVTYVSCYFTPNEAIEGYQRKLDTLEDTAREMRGELLVADDFNAKAVE